MPTYIRAFESLATCLYELSSFREPLLYVKQLAKLMEQTASFSDFSDFPHYHAQACDMLRSVLGTLVGVVNRISSSPKNM